MSTKVVVEISPETTTRPVLTSVSQATRPVGSSAMTASRTPSEIWSAILSGWPSVTDSEVNKYSLSVEWLIGRAKRLAAFGCSPVTTFGEVDDHRNPLEGIAFAQPVLDEVGVIAGQPLPRVDRDREARRPCADLRHVEHLQPVALLGG